MKEFIDEPQTKILRFDTGEEVIALLTQYALEHKITAGSFTAIGAAGEITLAYYDLEHKKYEDHVVTEDMEITGVIGNIAMLDGKPVIHAHGTFGKRDLSVVGGHVKKLTVSATCEVHLAINNGTLERAFDEKTGLNLLQ